MMDIIYYFKKDVRDLNSVMNSMPLILIVWALEYYLQDMQLIVIDLKYNKMIYHNKQ